MAAVIDTHVPAEACWYLHYVGCVPDRRRQGLGSDRRMARAARWLTLLVAAAASGVRRGRRLTSRRLCDHPGQANDAIGGMMIRRLLLCLALLIPMVSASADEGRPGRPENGRKVALIIANAGYANATRLGNPPNDARIVAAAAQRAGFESVTLAPDLGLVAFQNALRTFRAKAAGAAIAMIYYAGHGIEGSGKNWLIPVDAKLSSDLDLSYEAIELDRVMEAISGAQVRMVILDACRNNPFGRSWRGGTRAVTRGLGGVEVDDVLVIYAAAPGQTASDGTGGNSPFALSLSRRLVQPDLPIQLLGGLVRDDVLASTNGQQRPFISASITGTPVYLVARSPGAGGTTASAPSVDGATLDALAWQGAVGAGSREAFEEYRRQFPRGRFAALAEQNIARIGRANAGGGTASADAVGPPGSSGIAPRLLVPDSSRRAIARSELTALSAGELRIARNEIYARHGRLFTAPDLERYFSRFPWYRPKPAATVALSEVEEQNVILMQQEEAARGGR
ncbi:YARHG domain-containing protein [Sphingomonas solaris]|uniref:YARHG domain-containing protein n=1 Tax=Alterirhizorhabdus solaris TaxID=2529389 RepID=A0A558RBW0_9SPHN|nr:YARHG domain-containing protein [Sphingomonas solaris]